MSHMSSDPQDPFAEWLSAILAQSADTIHPHPDFAQQVRRRARAVAHPRRMLPQFTSFFASQNPVSSFALVALVVGALAWLLAGPGYHSFIVGLQGATPTPSPNCDNSAQYYNGAPPARLPPDHSVAIGASVTADGVTVTLDRAYADAIQTVVVYHVTHTATYKGAFDTLTDTSGQRYVAMGSRSSGVGDPLTVTDIFAPLPQRLLGSPQRLTLRLSGSAALPEGATPLAGTAAVGPWVIPFTITPVAGFAAPLSLAPQTHDGVTVQPEELDIAPAGGGIDEQNGGARVRIRVSGLPTTMPLYDVARYAFYFGRTGPGYGCGGKLTLRLPTGKEIIPGFLYPLGEYVPASVSDVAKVGSQTVGSSGSAEIEAMFYIPVQPGLSTMALTLDHIPLSALRDKQVVETGVANGPWVFDLPMSTKSGD